MILLPRLSKVEPIVRLLMGAHYSAPKGFVGRQLMYGVFWDQECYGAIGFGSATLHLPGREILGTLNNGLNNTFFHMARNHRKYPLRNFTTEVLVEAEERAAEDYAQRYGDDVTWFESLVEPPRTGDLYLKAGYTKVGETAGFTCKRVAGQGTDGWSGKRVWDTDNLRPKLVFTKARRTSAEQSL